MLGAAHPRWRYEANSSPVSTPKRAWPQWSRASRPPLSEPCRLLEDGLPCAESSKRPDGLRSHVQRHTPRPPCSSPADCCRGVGGQHHHRSHSGSDLASGLGTGRRHACATRHRGVLTDSGDRSRSTNWQRCDEAVAAHAERRQDHAGRRIPVDRDSQARRPGLAAEPSCSSPTPEGGRTPACAGWR